MLAEKPRERQTFETADLLSTSSTLLNLAFSGKASGGIPKGTVIHYVGDSDSGKTFFGLSLFAEAAKSKHFKDYDLRFWNAEGGAMMDRIHFFGDAVAERLQEENPETVEDFFHSMDDAFESDRPFVGLLDSMDALYPKAWLKKFKQNKKEAADGKDESGGYGMEKAKILSENLRRLRSRIRKSGSILVIISQTRDNVGGVFEKRTVSSGKALKFYSALQLWTTYKETLKKSVRGVPRPIGIVSKIDIKKNHINGNKRTVLLPIINDYGVDDVRSCIEFLIEEKHWRQVKGRIEATEFGFKENKISIEKLIRWIETNNEERELRLLVKNVWNDIEKGCQSNRKRRY